MAEEQKILVPPFSKKEIKQIAGEKVNEMIEAGEIGGGGSSQKTWIISHDVDAIDDIPFDEVKVGDIIYSTTEDTEYRVISATPHSVLFETGLYIDGDIVKNVEVVYNKEDEEWGCEDVYISQVQAGTKLYKHTVTMRTNASPVGAIIISPDDQTWESGDGLRTKKIVSMFDSDGYSVTLSDDEQLIRMNASGNTYYSSSTIESDLVNEY